ncbi:HNH endonuclease signature motif containing protein [Microbacterium atlanticum]|uniref:HNH endonuclease signature motif containing protein n=1 Tax=Microbacterium atlanticum TaxID=2782168 RepID=UPI00188857C6|nr:HNH endonuclease signature motif containing protein [Microbacterium atlanticum]
MELSSRTLSTWPAIFDDGLALPPDPWDEPAPDDELRPDLDVDALQATGELHRQSIKAIEYATVRSRALLAEQYAGIADVLRDAGERPDPWTGPDPTLDLEWRDPRGRTVAAVRAERREIAKRAAAAELAVCAGLSEATVRTLAFRVETLRQRCPRVWTAFASGQVSEHNANVVAQHAASLPDTAPDSWADYDAQVLDGSRRMPPPKFRLRARLVRERVHPESVDQRHRRAAEDRREWFTAEPDGMATLSIFGPAADVLAAHRRADAHARHLRAQPGEERTLAQLRADVLLDLLAHGETPQTGPAPEHAAVAITVPVMTLLGHDDAPATLDGYGPIDADIARRLAGRARSWVRILTHPVTGTVLDVDRRTYRVPRALRRWLGVRDPACIAPGCVRPARDCDMDHRVEWQYGGTTTDTNLSPLCKPHHVLKTESLWRLYRDEITGATWWITPMAQRVDPEPPPW